MLERLWLGGNGITHVGVTYLVDSLPRCVNLKTLTLDGNKLTEKAGKVLAELLEKCKTLTHLSLRYNKNLRDNGITAVAGALNATKLWALDVRETGATNVGIAALAKASMKCRTLTRLNVGLVSPQMRQKLRSVWEAKMTDLMFAIFNEQNKYVRSVEAGEVHVITTSDPEESRSARASRTRRKMWNVANLHEKATFRGVEILPSIDLSKPDCHAWEVETRDFDEPASSEGHAHMEEKVDEEADYEVPTSGPARQTSSGTTMASSRRRKRGKDTQPTGRRSTVL